MEGAECPDHAQAYDYIHASFEMKPHLSWSPQYRCFLAVTSVELSRSGVSYLKSADYHGMRIMSVQHAGSLILTCVSLCLCSVQALCVCAGSVLCAGLI